MQDIAEVAILDGNKSPKRNNYQKLIVSKEKEDDQVSTSGSEIP